jgi:hypothetical protein
MACTSALVRSPEGSNPFKSAESTKAQPVTHGRGSGPRGGPTIRTFQHRTELPRWTVQEKLLRNLALLLGRGVAHGFTAPVTLKEEGRIVGVYRQREAAGRPREILTRHSNKLPGGFDPRLFIPLGPFTRNLEAPAFFAVALFFRACAHKQTA